MKIGLVLSGGGVKGAAHIGTLKAITELGIKIDQISGTSAGAIVGALYAAGNSWEIILKIFKQTTIFDISKIAYRKPGFIDTNKFEKNLEHYLTDNSFEKLNIPLTITATEIKNGKLKAFDQGKLIHPILASSAFPGILTPIKIDGALYFDGGVVDDFPVSYLMDSCDYIIGSYSNPLSEISMEALEHSYQVLLRAFEINLYHQAQKKFHQCDTLLCAQELSRYNAFSMRSIQNIFELGYQEAHKKLLEVQQRLVSF